MSWLFGRPHRFLYLSIGYDSGGDVRTMIEKLTNFAMIFLIFSCGLFVLGTLFELLKAGIVCR